MIIAIGLASYIRRSLPLRRLLRRRIHEHAALQQDAVNVRDHRADVAARVALLLRPVEILLIALGEGAAIAFIHRVALVRLRRAQAALHQHERADGRVEHEHVDALARP